ncbi:MAG TPA: hypothetical protein VGH90_01175 [Chthoniobacteraceae bacterium]|jgi:hypothetical protein
MNSRPFFILAGVVLVVVVAAVWFLQSKPPEPFPVVTATPVPAPTSTPAPTKLASVATPAPKAPPAKIAVPSLPAGTPEPLPEWELKIDQVLRTNTGETEMAQMLINLLPTFPPEGQAEAAQHISNLILDKDYNRVLPLLKNPNLSEEVQDVLVTDLMNREDSVKLPALLDIAKIPNHPYHDEALTDLQIFVGQDLETDWGKWDAAVKSYLKQQAADANAQ